MPSLIGSDPDQVPNNGMLGSMAYQDAENAFVEKITVTGPELLVGVTSVEGFNGDSVARVGIGAIVTKTDLLNDTGTDFTDISLVTDGGGYQGFMIVSNTATGGANIRTHTTYSVFGRGTDASIQQIATDNGTAAACAFTVTVPTSGVIRVTNTSVYNTSVYIQFFGGVSF